MSQRSSKGVVKLLTDAERVEFRDFIDSISPALKVRASDRLHLWSFRTGRLLFAVQQRDGAMFTYAASRDEMLAVAKLCLKGWWQMRRKGLQ